MAKRRVVITGAAGYVAQRMYRTLGFERVGGVGPDLLLRP